MNNWCSGTMDDFGNLIHWSHIHQGQSCLGLTGWQDTMLDVVYDNQYGACESMTLKNKPIEQLEAEAYEAAYIQACELESPNSPGFDALHEKLYEQILEEEAAK